MVGINDYSQSHASNLGGCVNDVKNYINVFKSCFDTTDKKHFFYEELIDSEATRQDIIHLFRTHLGKATKDDIALFVYAGHGARSVSATSFNSFYPDGMDEGIVCYDSRSGSDKYDLVDKEISLLIKELEVKNNPHVAFILDSCHSGSATRSLEEFDGSRSRHWNTRGTTGGDGAFPPRPLNTYLKRDPLSPRPLSTYEASDPDMQKVLDINYERDLETRPVPNFKIPTGRHILLAACKRTQLAQEKDGRGRFSSVIQDIIEREKGAITYAELYSRAQTAMVKLGKQAPQFQPYGGFRGQTPFLGMDIDSKKLKFFTVQYHTKKEATPNEENNYWFINAGAVDLVTPSDVNIYDSSGETFLGAAKTANIQLDRTVLELPEKLASIPTGETSETPTYKAELTSIPDLSFIYLHGDPEGIKALKEHTNTSMGIAFVNFSEGTDYEIKVAKIKIANTEKYQYAFEVNRLPDKTHIQTIITPQASPGNGLELLLNDIVAPILRWERYLALQNREALNTERVVLDIELEDATYEVYIDENGKDRIRDKSKKDAFESNELVIPYNVDPYKAYSDYDELVADSIKPKFRIRNRTDSNIFAILLNFSSDYKIAHVEADSYVNDPIPKVAGNEPGRLIYDPLLVLDNENQEEGKPAVMEEVIRYKLIVSSQKIADASKFQQIITIDDEGNSHHVGITLGNTIEITRGDLKLLKKSQKPLTIDWFTLTFQLRLVRQHRQIDAKRATEIEEMGLTIEPHALSAKINTQSLSYGTRDANNSLAAFSILEKHGLELAERQAARDVNAEPHVLELTDIDNDEVLKEKPLTLIMDTPLNENEGLLPMAFDGEFFHIVGDSEIIERPVSARTTENDNVMVSSRISIQEIPDATVNRRSVGKALRLFIFKTVFDQNVNKLGWVDFSGDKPVTKTTELNAKVSEADNILLVIHGIIGSTKSMVEALPGIYDLDSLRKKSNLVLTYDYENLDTMIDETADLLKEALSDARLGPETGKKVTILAHSMGGLVSRWFIEEGGGEAFVKHLILAGTPNAGSPFGEIGKARKIMKVLAGLSIKFFPAAAPISCGLLTALTGSEKFTKTLEAMSPTKSKYIKKLKKNEAPIPYTVLAGDINLFSEAKREFFPQAIEKLGKSKVIDVLFDEDRNDDRDPLHDIAVSVDSIRSVHSSDDQLIQKYTVACHHMNYFTSDAGITQLQLINWMQT